MRWYTDLHSHSRFARACSPQLNLARLAQACVEKGVGLLGTGDFTHPEWSKELNEQLEPVGETGLYRLKDEFTKEAALRAVRFLATSEVSTILSTPTGAKKVHHLLHAPSLEEAAQITDALAQKWKAALASDGRPALAECSPGQLVELVKEASPASEIIAAHCLLPEELVHCNGGLKRICEVTSGDEVLTHAGRWRVVEQVMDREYTGVVYTVVPFYFRGGVSTTPEHPYLALRTVAHGGRQGVCRPNGAHVRRCTEQYFRQYSLAWIQAKDLRPGDALAFPRPRGALDREKILLSEILGIPSAELLNPGFSRGKNVRNAVPITPGFCRLIGYYLAEGYVVDDDCVGFSFHENEEEYLRDVEALMLDTFGVRVTNRRKEAGVKSVTLLFYSKILNRFFRRFCYAGGARAPNKQMPDWMLGLPASKQAELLRGWWRGDSGYTVSRTLANQMKLLCLRLGIIPSIALDSADAFERRGNHETRGRRVRARFDLVVFSHLSFFEDPADLLEDPAFAKFRTRRETRHGWMDREFAYLPVREIKRQPYQGRVYNLEVREDHSYVAEFAAVHNCWTPWFGVFGSRGGYDSLKEAYEDQARNVLGVETGMSSTPAMNWRIPELDGYAIISGSDLHSPYPWRLGRECCAFEFEEPERSYQNIMTALRKRDPKRFVFTVETDPAYGKYHYDGHRKCDISLPPEESKKLGGKCPVCKRRLTIGVLARVEQLAARPEGFTPERAIPFVTPLPLHELLAAAYRTQVSAQKVALEYQKLLARFGNEFRVLLDAPEGELANVTHEKVARAILLNRAGKVPVKPGYDGLYGEVQLPEELTLAPAKERKESLSKSQRALSDFSA